MEEKIFMQKQQIQMNLLFLHKCSVETLCHDVSETISKCFMGNYSLIALKSVAFI